MAAMPAIEYTDSKIIPEIAGGVRLTFLTHKTRSLQFRLVQLRRLYWGSAFPSLLSQYPQLTVASLKDNANAIEAACKLDLGKGIFETNISELNFTTNNIIYNINNLEKWARDEGSPDVPLDMMVLRPKIRKDPLGTVLIIGSVALNIAMSWLSEYSVADSCVDPTISQSIS